MFKRTQIQTMSADIIFRLHWNNSAALRELNRPITDGKVKWGVDWFSTLRCRDQIPLIEEIRKYTSLMSGNATSVARRLSRISYLDHSWLILDGLTNVLLLLIYVVALDNGCPVDLVLVRWDWTPFVTAWIENGWPYYPCNLWFSKRYWSEVNCGALVIFARMVHSDNSLLLIPRGQ